jgi:hypothetical protein
LDDPITDEMAFSGFGRCPDCEGAGCDLCHGEGRRERLFGPHEIAERLYVALIEIDKRERRQELEKDLAEMDGYPDP